MDARVKGEFVVLKELFGEVRGGSDYAEDRPEVKREQWTILEGEFVEGLMEERTQEMHVANDWKFERW